MIRPVFLNNIESKAFTSGYDIETKGLLKSTEQIFDAFSASDIGDTVIISRECGDLDLVKNVGGKSVGLSKFGDGNILLQVVEHLDKRQVIQTSLLHIHMPLQYMHLSFVAWLHYKLP